MSDQEEIYKSLILGCKELVGVHLEGFLALTRPDLETIKLCEEFSLKQKSDLLLFYDNNKKSPLEVKNHDDLNGKLWVNCIVYYFDETQAFYRAAFEADLTNTCIKLPENIFFPVSGSSNSNMLITRQEQWDILLLYLRLVLVDKKFRDLLVLGPTGVGKVNPPFSLLNLMYTIELVGDADANCVY